MPRDRFLPLLVLAQVLSTWGQSSASNEEWRAEKVAAANSSAAAAAAIASQYCRTAVPSPAIDEAAAQRSLETGSGWRDLILRLSDRAKQAEETGEWSLDETLDPSFFLKEALIVVLALILCVFWLLASWFVHCPCCCRFLCCCCQRKWSTGRVFKGIAWLLFCALGVAGVVLASRALTGATYTEDGVVGFRCASSTFVRDALGDPGPAAKSRSGFLAARSTLVSLTELLQDGSVFSKNLTAILDRTSAIESAAALADGLLTALTDNMAEAENTEPVDSSGATLYHECQVCGPLMELLTETSELLGTSAGMQMSALRSQAKVWQSQVTDLRKVLRRDRSGLNLGPSISMRAFCILRVMSNVCVIESGGWVTDRQNPGVGESTDSCGFRCHVVSCELNRSYRCNIQMGDAVLPGKRWRLPTWP